MYREAPAPASVVVTAFNHHVIAMSTKDGKELWRTNVPGVPIRVTIVSDRVVALGESLSCLDLATGERLWRADVGRGVLLVTTSQVFVSTSGALTCVSLADGKILWRNDLPGTGYGAAGLAVPGASEQADL